MLSIFQYNDYRTFLKDYHEHKKSSHATWSLGSWARQLGLKSPSGLLMILQGRRNPGPAVVTALARQLRLTPRESDFFANLVQLDKCKDDTRMTVLLMEKLSRDASGEKFVYLEHETFAAISHWYYYAIREMVGLPGFREDSGWIAKNLKFQISPKQAKSAIRTLLKLKLLARNRRGKLVTANGHFDTPSDVADEAVKRFHEAALDNAKLSLRTVPLLDREIHGTTFALSKRNLPKAKQLIRSFQNEFCNLLEESTSGDAVYHLELAFYPLLTLTKENDSEKTVH